MITIIDNVHEPVPVAANSLTVGDVFKRLADGNHYAVSVVTDPVPCFCFETGAGVPIPGAEPVYKRKCTVTLDAP